MNKKIALVLISSLSIPFLVYGAGIDDYKAKAKQFLDENGKSSSANKVDTIPTEPPKSRNIESVAPMATEEDKRHVTVHMKLANRHFSKKNYDKATEEVKSVFTRDPSNSGGHFMLAVIAGRQKQHKEAWYHIEAAKALDSKNQKIDDFISKLKTVSKKPEYEWIPGIYYGIPVDASERTFDLLDMLLKDECSQNITSIETSDFSGNDSKLTQQISFKALDSFSSNQIISTIKKYNGNDVVALTNSNKELKLKLTYQNVKAENSSAKPIKGINDFINDLIEEAPEIAIINTDESEPSAGKQEITYEISSREFSSINVFFRQISTYATKFIIQNMELAYIPGSQSATMWKAKIKVTYKI